MSSRAIRRILLCLPFGVAMDFAIVVLIAVGTLSLPSLSRAQTVDVSGLGYLDYFYNLSSPEKLDEDVHGFNYRRLYLTTDFTLSDRFEGRARLEANEGTSGPNGPVPFVKDLYLTWTYTGSHSATLGVTPPPAFETAENVWGYRSLEKTILDFQGIVDSRDFGIRFDGPITSDGLLRYAAMVANNSGSRMESDPYKRAYAQLSAHPSDVLVFTVGGDHAGYGDDRDRATRLSGFGGLMFDHVRAGLEGFWSRVAMDDGDTFSHTGLSLFGSARFARQWEVVARIDRARQEIPGEDLFDTFVLGGVSFRPNEFVQLIPNVWISKADEIDEAEVTGRFTVFLSF